MEKYRFPQCFGVVDGSHIPIVSPQYYPADYYNRKGWHSVILQGTVNHLGQFIDVNVGWPGRVHDARVFSNSKILASFFVQAAQTSTCTMMHTADLDTPKRCPMVLKSEPVDRYHRVIATLFFVMNRCSHNGVFLLN